jgi:hypothetical protein
VRLSCHAQRQELLVDGAWEADKPDNNTDFNLGSYLKQTALITSRQGFFVTLKGYMGLGPTVSDGHQVLRYLPGGSLR